jgi:hypothetical protein
VDFEKLKRYNLIENAKSSKYEDNSMSKENTLNSIFSDKSEILKARIMRNQNLTKSENMSRNFGSHCNSKYENRSKNIESKNVTLRPKSATLLKGVRTNRRFELQMQHRI